MRSLVLLTFLVTSACGGDKGAEAPQDQAPDAGNCGACAPNEACVFEQCVCMPRCGEGRACLSDGCGGSCAYPDAGSNASGGNGGMDDGNVSDGSDGGNDDGAEDAGGSFDPDAEVPVEGLLCQDTFCPRNRGGLLGQCCAGDAADECGLELQAPGNPSLGCFPEDAPGTSSPSCAPVLNALESTGYDSSTFDLEAGGMIIAFAVCCTSDGVCGADTNRSSLGDLGLGCVDTHALGESGPSSDAGSEPATEPNGLSIITNVFCDPSTGIAAACIPSSVPGPDGKLTKVPPFMKGACPATLKGGCIENVQADIQGCGEGASWDRVSLEDLCIDNVAKGVFGCDPVTAK